MISTLSVAAVMSLGYTIFNIRRFRKQSNQALAMNHKPRASRDPQGIERRTIRPARHAFNDCLGRQSNQLISPATLQ